MGLPYTKILDGSVVRKMYRARTLGDAIANDMGAREGAYVRIDSLAAAGGVPPIYPTGAAFRALLTGGVYIPLAGLRLGTDLIVDTGAATMTSDGLQIVSSTGNATADVRLAFLAPDDDGELDPVDQYLLHVDVPATVADSGSFLDARMQPDADPTEYLAASLDSDGSDWLITAVNYRSSRNIGTSPDAIASGTKGLMANFRDATTYREFAATAGDLGTLAFDGASAISGFGVESSDTRYKHRIVAYHAGGASATWLIRGVALCRSAVLVTP